MNHERVNNSLNRLPVAMAGIVHAFHVNWRGLSIFGPESLSNVKSLLP